MSTSSSARAPFTQWSPPSPTTFTCLYVMDQAFTDTPLCRGSIALTLPSRRQNDVTMSTTHGRTKVITGPNMGGKSSMVGPPSRLLLFRATTDRDASINSQVRTIALIVLMAQIGSYGPSLWPPEAHPHLLTLRRLSRSASNVGRTRRS